MLLQPLFWFFLLPILNIHLFGQPGQLSSPKSDSGSPLGYLGNSIHLWNSIGFDFGFGSSLGFSDGIFFIVTFPWKFYFRWFSLVCSFYGV